MKQLHAPKNLESKAGTADAEDGFVVLDGPDGVAITLTPEAANIMGESLIAASKVAIEQVRSRSNEDYDRIY